MSDDAHGWAIGDEGTILEYDGATWEHIESPTTYRLYDLVTDGGNGWAVGDYGTVLRLENGKWGL